MFLRVCFFLFVSSFSFPVFSGSSDSCSKVFSKNNQTPNSLEGPDPFVRIRFELTYPKEVAMQDIVERVSDYFQQQGLSVKTGSRKSFKTFVFQVENKENLLSDIWVLNNRERRDKQKGLSDYHFLQIITPDLKSKKDRELVYSLLEHLKKDCHLCSYDLEGTYISVNTGSGKNGMKQTLTQEDKRNIGKSIAIVERSLYDVLQVNPQRYNRGLNAIPISLQNSKKEKFFEARSHKESFDKSPKVVSLFEGGLKDKTRLERALSRPSVREGGRVFSFPNNDSGKTELSGLEKDVSIINKRSQGPVHINEIRRSVDFNIFNSTVNIKDIESHINFSVKLVSAVQNKDPRLMEFLRKHNSYSSADVSELFEILDIEPVFVSGG